MFLVLAAAVLARPLRAADARRTTETPGDSTIASVTQGMNLSETQKARVEELRRQYAARSAAARKDLEDLRSQAAELQKKLWEASSKDSNLRESLRRDVVALLAPDSRSTTMAASIRSMRNRRRCWRSIGRRSAGLG
jgi:hypothetical protein